MHRFYADLTDAASGARITLPVDEAVHAARVLRLRAGERVGLLDGLGNSVAARLVEVGSNVTAEIVEPLPPNEPRLRVTLYQGLPKLDKLEWIIQKSTELGVDRIVPVLFSRCDVKELSSDRVTRGNRVAREASKQCGRAWCPTVEPLITFEKCVARVNNDRLNGSGQAFLMWERATDPFVKRFLECMSSSDCESALDQASIIIGPEGGISDTEAERLISASALAVSLGSRILRAETAPVAALALALGLSGDMG
ncbi:ribosomal RNA small subunit methyltransferase E [Clostridia bacterium]|nr:ribosomal RNA small subunit methyltransferase E [Clostridia bacterium]